MSPELQERVLIVPFEPSFTETEQSELAECEAVVERGLSGFIEVGQALLMIEKTPIITTMIE